MDLSGCLAQMSMQHPAVFSVNMATRERGLASNFAVFPMKLTSFNWTEAPVCEGEQYVTECPALYRVQNNSWPLANF